jgi:hypothetical protein
LLFIRSAGGAKGMPVIMPSGLQPRAGQVRPQCREANGGGSTRPRTAEGPARSRWKHGLYSAEALAERKRVRELLTQSWELLKQMEGD